MKTPRQYTYDSSNVIATFSGIVISGYQTGSKLKIKRDADAYTKETGCDGDNTRSKSNNKAGEMELMLMQTSPSNDDLSEIYLLDEISNLGIRPFSCTDKGGRSLFFAENAWIRKVPDSDYNDKAGPRIWILDTGFLEVYVGGN